MSKISLIIKQHPSVWFFVFAFAITWAIWLVGTFLPKDSFIGVVAVFGPAVAAIVVAACMDSSPSHASVKKRLAVFFIVFAIGMVNLAYLAIRSNYYGTGLFISYTVCVLITAYSFSSVYHPIAGVAQLFSGLKQKNKKTIWLLFAFLLPFAFQILAALVDLGLGGAAISVFTFAAFSNLMVGYTYMFIFGGPAAEEPGWRGFAVPQMQKWLNPLMVGILIGFMWTLWHIPLYFTGDYPGGVEAALFRFAWNLPLGVMFSWVYNKSGGNLLAALLLHASNNIAVNMFGPSTQNLVFVLMIIFTVIAAVGSKMWQKTNSTNPKQPTIAAGNIDRI